MKNLHSLLQRQIKKCFGGTDMMPAGIRDFIEAVNAAYLESDMERGMLERSLELSSQEMLQINAEMRAVFQALPDMLLVVDADGKILDHKTGTVPDMYPDESRLVGRTIQSIQSPGVANKFQEALANARRCNTQASFRYSLDNKGTENFYEARIVPVSEERFSIIIRNMTDSVVSEEKLRKERDFSSTLVQSSPAFFVTVNTEGKVIMMNSALLNALGYEEAEVRGLPYLKTFIPSHCRKTTLDKFNTLADQKSPMVYENFIRAKSGKELLVEWHVRAILNSIGAVDFYFGVGIDITGRRNLEEQLRQAQRMEAIGTLAGGIAHDFNNLLMGIQGRTSLMLMETDPDNPNFEQLKGIEEHVKSATGLTRQLLGFARGGKYEVKPRNLNTIIMKSAEMFGRTRKEIQLHYRLDENIWTVEVDQGQIEQVMLNLFLNAGQAMPGGGEIYLSTENVTLDENYVEPHGMKAGRYVQIKR
jgi:PAS domain S-box-containing protein